MAVDLGTAMKTAQPVLWFDRAALREIDRRAVEEFHIPILTLMENAGRGVADVAQRHIRLGKGALVVCGTGNNGGDGLVCARHLHNAGIRVQLLFVGERGALSAAAAAQMVVVEAMKLPMSVEMEGHAELRNWIVESDPQDIIIDAIFGTGLSRDVTGLAKEVIHAINVSKRTVVAVDIPSGLDCDSGKPLGEAVHAAETVSFCGMKIGFAGAEKNTGKISIADIGVPRELLAQLAVKPS
jgi:NAD(P)H-hydrate epimerase